MEDFSGSLRCLARGLRPHLFLFRFCEAACENAGFTDGDRVGTG